MCGCELLESAFFFLPFVPVESRKYECASEMVGVKKSLLFALVERVTSKAQPAEFVLCSPKSFVLPNSRRGIYSSVLRVVQTIVQM